MSVWMVTWVSGWAVLWAWLSRQNWGRQWGQTLGRHPAGCSIAQCVRVQQRASSPSAKWRMSSGT